MFDHDDGPDFRGLLLVILKALAEFYSAQSVPEAQEPSPASVYMLECDQIAPSYGVLAAGSVIGMDVNLKVAIAATARALQNIPPQGRTWTAIMGTLTQCSVLDPCPDSDINRADCYYADRTNWFKKSENYDAVVKEVQAWFTKLIVDPDILKLRSAVDLKVVSSIVAHAGNVAEGLCLYKKEKREKTLLDVGMVRYPDPEHPFIKVYRIELRAWYDSRVVLGRARDQNGIVGEFSARTFKPRNSVIEQMRLTVLEKAVSEANGMFIN
ncbi:hypothetical protein AURDEDRAFT_164346 [Auricularia subglabra TFB-10046 SS5]|nr:hypothetical protein AURDEDRAFT_164346 [Auricularia subglabra TFB-10046 SS5]